MGTRGLTGFICDSKWLATYNHWDSYPEGLGMQVLNFCKSIINWDDVKEQVRGVDLVKEGSKPTRNQKKMYEDYSNTGVSEGSLNDWYCLLRELQGVGILKAIADNRVWHMIDSHNFIQDSLFCEWAYIIDLDEMKLRVYKGFQNEPYPENVLPADVPFDYKDESCSGTVYYPCKQLHAYSLKRLPKFMLGVRNTFKEEYKKAVQ